MADQIKQYITIKKWIPYYKNPIKLSKGEKVILGKEDDQWKGWIWCVSPDNAGWVPAKIIKSIEDSKGEILDDYEATELLAEADEIISEIREVNGWIWGKNESSNQIGWIPKENLKEINE